MNLVVTINNLTSRLSGPQGLSCCRLLSSSKTFSDVNCIDLLINKHFITLYRLMQKLQAGTVLNTELKYSLKIVAFSISSEIQFPEELSGGED